MPYEIKLDTADAIVRVLVRGALSYRESLAARLEAGRLLEETHFHRLLVDMRELTGEDRPGTMECFDFGASYPGQGIARSIRIAHILPTDPARRENIKFITTVAVNRGATVREFDDPDRGRAWLLESGECPPAQSNSFSVS